MMIMNTALDFDDVLILPADVSYVNSRKNVDLRVPLNFFSKNKFQMYGKQILPIFASNMDGVGTLEMARELTKFNMITCLTKFVSVNDILRLLSEEVFFAISIGIEDTRELFEQLIQNDLQNKPIWINVDIANGHLKQLSQQVRHVRKTFSNAVIIAGNVVTRKAAISLWKAGADIVKLGIGSGSACTTRIQTGIGKPQLQTILDCRNLPFPIMSDGGCKNPGDIVKAIAAGASFVMLGGMLAGHDESGQSAMLQNKTGLRVVEFHGMSSKTANEMHCGGLQDYRASEGRELLIPYRGLVKNTIKNILGGIRSACTYTNSSHIYDLRKNARFIRVNSQYNSVFEKYSIES